MADRLELMRLDAESADIDNARSAIASPSGAPSIVARTKAVTTYPTVAARLFACEPLSVLGAEVEGTTATKTLRGGTTYAFNLGASIPPVGSEVLLTYVAYRWVFSYG
jgi:hypothetical protein